MGLHNELFPFTFKTGTISSVNTAQDYSNAFLSALDAGCDLFICNLFMPDTLTSMTVDLDQCFISSDQIFTKKQLPHACPLINSELFSGTLQHRSKILKFIVEYFVYLGLKRIAIRFDLNCCEEMCRQITKVAKILKSQRIGVILIVPIKKGDNEADCVWKAVIKCRQELSGLLALQFCLEVCEGGIQNKRIFDRWWGESIDYLSFSHKSFRINQKGYPVLPVQLQEYLKKAYLSNVHPFVSFTPKHEETISEYFKYYGFGLEKLSQNMSDYDLKVQQLVDHIQIPLQPYRDNLEAEVYDIFEKDQNKYNEYEIALSDALSDITEERTIICYYVGSGKGLILQKLMKAAKKLKKLVKVFCIEKNPYPLQTLKRRIARNKWTKFVEIIQSDIKDYKMLQTPDIIFSELLGGFGDNQLSPECLKWAEKNCDKNTKCIPQAYTSFLRPVSAYHLHKQLVPAQKQEYFTVYFSKYFSPFKSQPIWKFAHPLPKEDSLNREGKISWKVLQDICIHGLQGSFDCNLYGKGYFSIVAQNKDKHFYSWFPLFFSFSEEEMLEKGEEISVEMLRCRTETKIWYQWRYFIAGVDQQVRKESGWHNKEAHLAIEFDAEM